MTRRDVGLSARADKEFSPYLPSCNLLLCNDLPASKSDRLVAHQSRWLCAGSSRLKEDLLYTFIAEVIFRFSAVLALLYPDASTTAMAI